MGYVNPDQLLQVQNQTDFLLSIGNHLTGDDMSLPSKVLEYIAIGKPIIHVFGGPNDSAVDYLEKYGLSCIIYPDDDFNENVQKVLNYIDCEKGKEISYNTVKALFPENTPGYTAKQIKQFLNGNK